METATASEFASSDGYIAVQSFLEGWDAYKADNFVAELAEAKQTDLANRIAAIQGKLEASEYHKYGYIGTESNVQLYDEGLYVSVKPDKYPNNDNAVYFKEKMTLNENAQINFNLIYGLRKLGAFQMQIAFYPVAGTNTKDGVDGVRVDFWLTEAGVTEVKPVNGKDESTAIEGATLTLTDEDFFDFQADELDYSVSDYEIKLLSRTDGSLYVLINGLEMDIVGEGLNADLYKDGVYVTITGCGYEGTNNNELLITRLGSTEYADLEFDAQPDDGNGSNSGDVSNSGNASDGDTKEESGSCFSSIGLTLGSVVLACAAAVVVRAKKKD